jgi:release factor glutamine methyltransferase
VTTVTLKTALTSAIERLTAAHIGSPRLNAEILLMFALGCDRAYFFAHPERELTNDELFQFEELVGQRASGIPAQYLTGHQEFWGMDFIVTPAVLIPRPETEHVIEVVLPLMRGLDRPRMVDVGTGSGCIAVVLAKELPEAQINAVDISAAALEIARANATRNQVEGRVDFQQGDLLAGFAPASLDLVVSNPPYVGESEEDQVQLEVRKFEPRNAVFAGHTGLEIIERLAPQAEAALKSGGWLVMEISGTIVDGVKHILKEWDGVQISNDLQGIPRVVSARRR